jgi:hypothetical protein
MTWTEPSSRSVIEKALSLGEAFPLISGQTLVRQFGIQIEKHLKIKSTCNCFVMDKNRVQSKNIWKYNQPALLILEERQLTQINR